MAGPTFERVAAVVRGVPHMKERRARELTEFVRRERPARILELGTSHGVSTCYLAAAVAAYGGRVTTMDKVGNDRLRPNVFDLLGELDLADRVDVVMAERSFTWELMKILRDRPDDRFDFCFFDGGHVWDVTGFTFFLVDRMLAPGGWVLFDDLEWTVAASRSLSGAGFTDEEAQTAQVALVFDLLVAGHGAYDELRRDGNWGWARKRPTGRDAAVERARAYAARGADHAERFWTRVRPANSN